MEVRFYVQLVNCSVFRCFTNSASVALLDCAMSVASFDMDDWSEERFMCSCTPFESTIASAMPRRNWNAMSCWSSALAWLATRRTGSSLTLSPYHDLNHPPRMMTTGWMMPVRCAGRRAGGGSWPQAWQFNIRFQIWSGFTLSGNLTLFKNHEPDDGMVAVPFGGRIIPGHAKGSVTIFIWQVWNGKCLCQVGSTRPEEMGGRIPTCRQWYSLMLSFVLYQWQRHDIIIALARWSSSMTQMMNRWRWWPDHLSSWVIYMSKCIGPSALKQCQVEKPGSATKEEKPTLIKEWTNFHGHICQDKTAKGTMDTVLKAEIDFKPSPPAHTCIPHMDRWRRTMWRRRWPRRTGWVCHRCTSSKLFLHLPESQVMPHGGASASSTVWHPKRAWCLSFSIGIPDFYIKHKCSWGWEGHHNRKEGHHRQEGPTAIVIEWWS